MAINCRDFVEKTFGFYDNGKYYRYSCSVPNSELPGPNGEPPLCPILEKNTVRGYTMINVAMSYRDPTDGKIIMHSLA